MGRYSIHIDCLYWVKRDAFLPQGSHGLKAVMAWESSSGTWRSKACGAL